MRFRGWLYGLGMKKCGKDFQVTHDAIIKGIQYLCVGNNVFVGNHTIIMGHGKCIICDQVQIGPHCVVISGNHSSINGSYRYGKSNIDEIKLGYGSWIGANCTITAGSQIPACSIIAANSCVTKKMESFDKAIYGGVPAKFIKTL